MKRSLLFIFTIILVTFPLIINVAEAHPGRTDANGGHTCRTNCAKWGLKTGEYHYHNKPAQTTTPAVKPVQPKSAPTSPKLAELMVYVDGEKQTYDQPPVVENGRTLVPMRAIFEKLGADIKWDQQIRSVTATKDGINISLTIDKNTATINGKIITLETSPKIINGSTMVPIRFVSEALGAMIIYDDTNRTIKITSKR